MNKLLSINVSIGVMRIVMILVILFSIFHNYSFAECIIQSDAGTYCLPPGGAGSGGWCTCTDNGATGRTYCDDFWWSGDTSCSPGARVTTDRVWNCDFADHSACGGGDPGGGSGSCMPQFNPFNVTDLANPGRYALRFENIDAEGDCSGNVRLNGEKACGEEGTWCDCGNANSRCTTEHGTYSYGVGGVGITSLVNVNYDNANEWEDPPGSGNLTCSHSSRDDCGNFKCPNPRGEISSFTVEPNMPITFTIRTDLVTDTQESVLGQNRRLYDTSGGATTRIVHGNGSANHGNSYLHDCVFTNPDNKLVYSCSAPNAIGSYTATFTTNKNCDVNFNYQVVTPTNTPTPTPTLPASTNLIGSCSVFGGPISLSWQYASTNGDYFNIKRNHTSGGWVDNRPSLATTDLNPVPTRSFADTRVVDTNEILVGPYNYQVQACYPADACGPFSSPEVVVNCPTPPPLLSFDASCVYPQGPITLRWLNTTPVPVIAESARQPCKK